MNFNLNGRITYHTNWATNRTISSLMVKTCCTRYSQLDLQNVLISTSQSESFPWIWTNYFKHIKIYIYVFTWMGQMLSQQQKLWYLISNQRDFHTRISTKYLFTIHTCCKQDPGLQYLMSHLLSLRHWCIFSFRSTLTLKITHEDTLHRACAAVKILTTGSRPLRHWTHHSAF